MQDAIQQLRNLAIEVNRAFAEMAHILSRIHLMSYNANLASFQLGAEGMSFSVIVTELRTMTNELKDQITEAEKEFAKVAIEVAKWLKNKRFLSIYQRSISSLRENGDVKSSQVKMIHEWEKALDSRSFQEWSELKEGAEQVESKLWDSIFELRNQIRKSVINMEKFSAKLMSIIERIDIVASRKSNFRAVTSMVESARIESVDNSLATVSENIKLLAGDIVKGEKKASDRITVLMMISSKMANNIRNEKK